MKSDQPSKIFVLIHGAWHGAWAFEKLAPLLVQEGHAVTARDMPGHGLRARFPRSYFERPLELEKFAAEPSPIAYVSQLDCTDEVVAIVSQLAKHMPERRIILVGHSLAGLTLNLVGEAIPQLISRLVYLSAFMTANGKALNDYVTGAEFATAKVLSITVGDPGITGAFRIDPRSADSAYRAQLKATFAADLDDEDWQAVANLLTPDVPAAPNSEPSTVTTERWGAIPRTYISCVADYTVPIAAQRRFIDDADAFTPDNPTDVREMATSHSPFWSQPEQLARILLQL